MALFKLILIITFEAIHLLVYLNVYNHVSLLICTKDVHAHAYKSNRMYNLRDMVDFAVLYLYVPRECDSQIEHFSTILNASLHALFERVVNSFLEVFEESASDIHC